MTVTQRCSSASDIRAGMSTTVRSPSRYAETVLRRRALLRTSIALAPEPLGGWLVVLRCGFPARCSGSAGTPRRYPLYTREVPAPERFDTDPHPERWICTTNPGACGQLPTPEVETPASCIRRWTGHETTAGPWRATPSAYGDVLRLREQNMHPMVKPALRRGWRDLNTVQFGMAHAHAMVLGPIDTATGSFLALLDGTRGLPLLRDEGRRMDLPDGHVDGLVERLTQSGLLDDATGGGPAADALRQKGTAMDRLRPDLAALSLVSPEPGGAMGRLAARRSLRVQVRGAGRVGVALASLLAGAGVGCVDVRDVGRVEPWDVAPGGLPADAIGERRDEAARRAVRRAAPDRPLRRTPPPPKDPGFSLVILAPRDGRRCPRTRACHRRTAHRLGNTAPLRGRRGGHGRGGPAGPARRDGLRGLSGPGAHRPGPSAGHVWSRSGAREDRVRWSPATWPWRRRSPDLPRGTRSPSWTGWCPPVRARAGRCPPPGSAGTPGRCGHIPHACARPRREVRRITPRRRGNRTRQ